MLSQFGIDIASFTIGIGQVYSDIKPKNIADIRKGIKDSQLNCIDKNKEIAMIGEINKARKQKDSLGGIVEIWAQGVCPGIGSVTHFDKRLDAKLAYYLMSIPSVKGVEIGAGFEYAKNRGSQTHDRIYFSDKKGFFHKIFRHIYLDSIFAFSRYLKRDIPRSQLWHYQNTLHQHP